jgi:hypothetical protein
MTINSGNNKMGEQQMREWIPLYHRKEFNKLFDDVM